MKFTTQRLPTRLDSLQEYTVNQKIRRKKLSGPIPRNVLLPQKVWWVDKEKSSIEQKYWTYTCRENNRFEGVSTLYMQAMSMLVSFSLLQHASLDCKFVCLIRIEVSLNMVTTKSLLCRCLLYFRYSVPPCPTSILSHILGQTYILLDISSSHINFQWHFNLINSSKSSPKLSATKFSGFEYSTLTVSS